MRNTALLFIAGIFVFASSVFAQDMTIDSNGLTVEGNIEIKTGGIIFPDGTVLDNAYLNTNDGPPHGQPFQALQQQIDELQEQLDVIQLIPGPQGPEGPQGPSGPQGPPGDTDNLQQQIDELKLRLDAIENTPQGIKVYDGNGNYLCELIDVYGLTCFIPSHERLITIGRFSGLFLAVGTGIYFETNDCQGQPYVKQEWSNSIVQDGNLNYYKTLNVKAQQKQLSSLFQANGFCDSSDTNNTVVPVEQIAPPFAFPIELPFIFK